MAFQTLSDLRAGRAKDLEDKEEEEARSFGDSFLTLDQLQHQHAQQKAQQDKWLHDAKHEDEKDNIDQGRVQIDQARMGVEKERADIDNSKAEAARAASDEKVGRDALPGFVAGYLDREGGRPTGYDPQTGEPTGYTEPAPLNVTGDTAFGKDADYYGGHLGITLEDQAARDAMNDPRFGQFNDSDIRGEFAKQRAARQGGSGLKWYQAGTARTNATRPRVQPHTATIQPHGLEGGQQKEISDADGMIQTLNDVEDAVRSGKVDPGPISNLMASARQFIGIRNSTDDVAKAQLSEAFNNRFADVMGRRMENGEAQRALTEMPSFGDDNEGFLALIGVMRRMYVRKHNNVRNVAVANDRGRGAATTLDDVMPAIDEITGRPVPHGQEDMLRRFAAMPGANPAAPAGRAQAPAAPPAAGQPAPPRQQGEGRKAYALRLMKIPGMTMDRAYAEAAK